jgi:biotin carboxyl carrier protein
MRYFVTIGGRTVEVDLEGPEPTVEGRTVSADMRTLPGTPVRHLLVDGRSVPVVLRPGPRRGEWDVRIEGRHYEAEVVDERTRAINEMTGGSRAARGPKPVRAPMPGLVVRVEVEAGETVAPGQGIVIVEAMKMENELKADGGGVVSRVHVAAGQAVEKGTVLVEFESD